MNLKDLRGCAEVLPSSPKLNPANLGFGYAVLPSEHDQGPAASRTNRIYVDLTQFAAQLFAASRDAANLPPVHHIALRRHVFKICNVVVGFVQVFVIDLQSLWTRAKKGVRDHAGNPNCLSRSPPTEYKDTVSIGIGWRRQNSPGLCARSRGVAPDASLIGDAIPVLITGNWTPFFKLQGQFWGGILRLHRKTPFGAMWAAVTSGAPTFSIAEREIC